MSVEILFFILIFEEILLRDDFNNLTLGYHLKELPSLLRFFNKKFLSSKFGINDLINSSASIRDFILLKFKLEIASKI